MYFETTVLKKYFFEKKKEKRDRKSCKRQRASKEEIVLHCLRKFCGDRINLLPFLVMLLKLPSKE